MPIVHLALGANIPGPAGPPEATLAAAAERLAALGRIAARSRLYSTAPVGRLDQPRFLNAVLALEMILPPQELLDQLLRIEREFGRDRSASLPNGPRTLDLDILLYGKEIVREPGLEIPHPRLAQRAFVLVPLAEIASNLVVPGTSLTVQQLLQRLRTGLPTESDAVLPTQSSIWRSSRSVDPRPSGGASG
jgi:2-amino-4-hydroxy-6-hydroxymethyldihydropteridine diphosphokinase